jgi:hypothetical protein
MVLGKLIAAKLIAARSPAVELGPLSESDPIIGELGPSFPICFPDRLLSQTEAFFRLAAEPAYVGFVHRVVLLYDVDALAIRQKPSMSEAPGREPASLILVGCACNLTERRRRRRSAFHLRYRGDFSSLLSQRKAQELIGSAGVCISQINPHLEHRTVLYSNPGLPDAIRRVFMWASQTGQRGWMISRGESLLAS